MLETAINQGMGLQRMAAPAGLQLLSMISHGDKASELPLLWNLCSTWARLGYAVVVLDATADENDVTPGLAQMLAGTEFPETGSSAGWSVLPAALGVQLWRTQEQPAQRLQQDLLELFPHHDIVLCYADARLNSALFRDSGLAPVLPVTAQTPFVVSAYQGLKELLLNAGLLPTIVEVADEAESVEDAPGTRRLMIEKLQDCAENFLGRQIGVQTLHVSTSGTIAGDAAERLALRMLENALPLTRHAGHRPTLSMTARTH